MKNKRASANMRMIRNRLLATLPLALLATGLTSCDPGKDTPPPAQEGAPPADDKQPYPNLGTVRAVPPSVPLCGPARRASGARRQSQPNRPRRRERKV